MIDVLILNYNCASETITLVQTLQKYEATIRYILIVDNKSTDESFQTIQNAINNKNTFVITTPQNGGYGYGNNIGFTFLKERFNSEYVLLCNPDIAISEKAIKEMEMFLGSHDNYLAVAPFMLDANQKKNFSTAYKIPRKIDYIFSMTFCLGHYFSRTRYSRDFFKQNANSYIDVETVAGSLYMINLNNCPTTAIYDEGIFLYCEETVFGLYAKRLNMKIGLLLDEVFVHNHSVSISKSFSKARQRRSLLLRSRLYLLRKYYSANQIEIRFAIFLGFISYLELFIFRLLRKRIV